MRTIPDSERTAHYLATLESLQEFAQKEVHGVVTSLLMPTETEECWLVIYLRMYNCVGSLLALGDGPHIQANSMLARTLFELESDLELLDVEKDSVEKMRLYIRLEYGRACRAIMAANKLQGAPDSETQGDYLKNAIPGIEADAVKVWGLPPSQIQHWSAKKLPERLKSLEVEMQLVYHTSYKIMSWNTHTGLTGYLHVPEVTFNSSISRGLSLACLMYHRMLARIVQKLGLVKIDPSIGGKLEFALARPCCETERDVMTLRREYGL